MRRCLILFAVVICAMVFTQNPATSEESLTASNDSVNRTAFSVNTEVYVGAENQPTIRTVTRFLGSQAIDEVLDSSRPISCFDFDSQTVTLLDRRAKKRASISFSDLLRFQAQLTLSAEKAKGLGAFLARPTFVREFDASEGTITLSSPWINYKAAGVQAPSDMVESFNAFADASSRLASMLSPTAPPAQARLELNKALKNRNWQVTSVTRTGGPRATELGHVRSEHRYREDLTEEEQNFIEAVKKELKSFEEISFSDFRALQNSGRVATK